MAKLDMYDEVGNLSLAYRERMAARLRPFLGANGLWYAAAEDARGFHTQGVGRHPTASAALASARQMILEGE